jgi:hypothetical protein
VQCHGDGGTWADDWAGLEEWRSRRPVVDSQTEDDLVEQYFIVLLDYVAVPPMQCEHCGAGSRGVLMTGNR